MFCFWLCSCLEMTFKLVSRSWHLDTQCLHSTSRDAKMDIIGAKCPPPPTAIQSQAGKHQSITLNGAIQARSRCQVTWSLLVASYSLLTLTGPILWCRTSLGRASSVCCCYGSSAPERRVGEGECPQSLGCTRVQRRDFVLVRQTQKSYTQAGGLCTCKCQSVHTVWLKGTCTNHTWSHACRQERTHTYMFVFISLWGPSFHFCGKNPNSNTTPTHL